MSTREPLPGFDDRAPSDRYCDLILTGGVTSSIAYNETRRTRMWRWVAGVEEGDGE